MTALLVLALLVTVAALAPWLGADSRRLSDDAPSRDALWSR